MGRCYASKSTCRANTSSCMRENLLPPLVFGSRREKNLKSHTVFLCGRCTNSLEVQMNRSDHPHHPLTVTYWLSNRQRVGNAGRGARATETFAPGTPVFCLRCDATIPTGPPEARLRAAVAPRPPRRPQSHSAGMPRGVDASTHVSGERGGFGGPEVPWHPSWCVGSVGTDAGTMPGESATLSAAPSSSPGIAPIFVKPSPLPGKRIARIAFLNSIF